ncbi:MAG: hypothetical protein SOX43_01670 [Pelistega sp.]|nr:hypothetical protein [Pelistega sp.]
MIDGILLMVISVGVVIGITVAIADALGENLGCLFLVFLGLVLSYVFLPLWVNIFWLLLISLMLLVWYMEYREERQARQKREQRALLLDPLLQRILAYQEKRHAENAFLLKRGKIKVLANEGFMKKVRELKWSKRKKAYLLQEGFTKTYYVAIEEFQTLENKAMEGDKFLVRIEFLNGNSLDLKVDEREYQRITSILGLLRTLSIRQREELAAYFHRQANIKNWVDMLIEAVLGFLGLGFLVVLAMMIADMVKSL